MSIITQGFGGSGTGTGATTPINAQTVDSARTWYFRQDELVSGNYIHEIIGFTGILAMDFAKVLGNKTTILAIQSVDIAPVGPSIGIVGFSLDYQAVCIAIDTDLTGTTISPGTYTLTTVIQTFDTQYIARQGKLILV